MEWVASCPPLGDLPKLGIKPGSPSLRVDSLSSEPPGKPKNTGVGSLSFLQGIFLTQESTQGLLHCRQILYQLSYQGSPYCRDSQRFPLAQTDNQATLYSDRTTALFLQNTLEGKSVQGTESSPSLLGEQGWGKVAPPYQGMETLKGILPKGILYRLSVIYKATVAFEKQSV